MAKILNISKSGCCCGTLLAGASSRKELLSELTITMASLMMMAMKDDGKMTKMMTTVRSVADCPRIKASVASEASAASPVVTLVFAHNALGIKNSSATPATSFGILL